MVTVPSSHNGGASHTSAISELHSDEDDEPNIYVDVIKGNDDEDDDSSAWIKSLGSTFRGVEELVTHPKADDDGIGLPDRKTSSSMSSDFDYQGEYEDYKYARGILKDMGGECEELAALPHNHPYFHDEMPDSSRMIMAKFHDAYAKHHTGYPVFHGDKVSDELRQSFLDLACDVSKHRPHLTVHEKMNERSVDEEEPRLNIGCFEYPRRRPAVWSEDFDEISVHLEKECVIVGLNRSGIGRTIIYEKMKIRKDIPEDPMAFSSGRKGIEAARALAGYQDDDEQIVRDTPIPDSDRPCFEGDLPLDDLPEGTWDYLHDFLGENDGFVQGILDRLEKLRAEPEEYDRLVANGFDHAAGSGIFRDRTGLEEDIMVELWNDLHHGEECDTEILRGQGLLNPEDDFGDNPEYLKAKKLWWEQRMGIRGIEAIVRYHMEHIRARRCPNRRTFFLTEHDDANVLNYNSPEYPAPRAEIQEIAEEDKLYEMLHANPVDWTAKAGCQIRAWRLSVTDIVPHDDFDDDQVCREAYDALVEYQESWEPETHNIHDIAERCDSVVELEADDDIIAQADIAHLVYLPGISAAHPMVKDNASVSSPEAFLLTVGLMEHIRATRDDEVVDLTNAATAGFTVTSRPDVYLPVCETLRVVKPPSPKFIAAFLEKKASIAISRRAVHLPVEKTTKAANAPSPKFLKAFREKKTSMSVIRSSIQVPPGIIAAYQNV
jgi:hypothetical protein